MKFFLGLLAFICISFTAAGQRNITLTGSLYDKTTDQPVDLGTVRLLTGKDSTLVKGEMSDSKGVFSMSGLSKGNYLLEVSYMGYKGVFKPVSLSGNDQNVNLGKILLETDDILLEEAVIVGTAAEVVVRNDTVEYNASSYKTEENAVVEDLLKKLPGVEVDKDGKITVNGKEIKKFLVEGKEFVSDDPKVASKNLPAEMVEKLQVLDRKSDMAQLTGFDDGEEEAVINITVRPGMKKGTIGNAAVGMGQDINIDKDLRYMAGGMLNHMKDNNRYTLMVNTNNTNNMGASDMGEVRFGGMRGRGGSGGILETQNIMLDMNKEFSKKLTLNGSVSYNRLDRSSETEVRSFTFSDKISQRDSSITKGHNISDNLGFNFRLEWKPDSNNTLIFRPEFSYNKSNNDQEKLFYRFNGFTSDTLFSGASGSHYDGEGYYMGGRLDYSHKFSKPGRVLSAQLRASYNDNYSYGASVWEQRMFDNGLYDRDSVRNQRMESDNMSANMRFMVSYVEPIGRNNFVQFLYRGIFDNSENINSTYNVFGNTYFGLDTMVLYGNQSRSTLRNSFTNRAGISFKSVRQKYNYTIGVNFDPSNSVNKTYQPYSYELTELIYPASFDGRLPNVRGDSLLPEVRQNVPNFSPELNFNYFFDKRSNLRIDYEGNTTQPTAEQLKAYVDDSDPMNVTMGNPSLKPGYAHEFRARFNKSIPESQLFYNFNLFGNFSENDIARTTILQENGSRLTTYKNINGNWNVMLMGGFNTPLKNKKFTVGNFMRTGLSNQNSYSNEQKNIQKNLQLMDNVRFNYRCDLFDIGTNFSLNYRKVTNDIRPQNDLETYDWGIGGNTTWYLPHNLTIASDITWTKRDGYDEGFNISEAMWNASVSKQLFNKKFGTGTLKLAIYDILQDRSSVSGGNTTNGYSYTRSNVIPSYFMGSFIYRFTAFPKGSSASEKDFRGGDRRWGDGPPRGGGGGGGRPPF